MRQNQLVRLIIGVIMICALPGCVTRRDVSTEPPFSGYVNSRITLPRDVTLRKAEVHGYAFLPYSLWSPESGPAVGEIVRVIPAGSIVTVDKVMALKVLGETRYYAICRVRPKNSEDDIAFEDIKALSEPGERSLLVFRWNWEY